MSLIFSLKFNSIISFKLRLKLIPKTVKGSCDHYNSMSVQSMSIRSLLLPIHMHLVFSKLGVKPEYFEK